jgi:glutaredoxin
MRVWLPIVTVFLLLQDHEPLRLFARGSLGYDAARHGEVLLLGTAGCMHCTRMRAFLRAGGVPYRELDVERDPEGRRRYAALGEAGVPVLIVAGRVIRGYDPGAVRAALALP